MLDYASGETKGPRDAYWECEIEGGMGFDMPGLE